MSFAKGITRCPIPFDPVAGAEATALVPDQPPEIREVLIGAAGGAPYLRGLMGREGAWLAEALAAPPGEVIPDLLAATRALPDADLSAGLRRMKRRLALYAGLADLAGVWALEDVTQALTDFAGLSTDRAMKAGLAPLLARGKIPSHGAADLADAAGMVALAMGKMGAGELNYSSDIDLIVLFDDARFEGAEIGEARAAFIRATRAMTALLSEMTGEGYVWRTDLRLRPDPSVTPVCLAMEAAERYYESLGRTWERAAHIKARAAAGDLAAGEAYLERLTPFVWRRHLDFAAIEDAHDMRLRIREHRGLHDAETLEGRNLKLGPGGIREIEFFTQTRQLIAGGRDRDLRSRGTVESLARLAAKGWIPGDVAERLTENYRRLREIEHRVQMVADARTHALPTKATEFDRIARLCGEAETAVLRAELAERFAEVSALTEHFFARSEARTDTPRPIGEEPALVARWRHYPALRSARAQAIFERLKPDLLSRLQAADRPDEALAAFDGFLSGLPAGVQLFAMFEANPHLRGLLVDIAATSPALSRYLSRHSRVLEAVVSGSFFEPWPGREALTRGLADVLAGAGDYESQLDAARRWMQEWHFRCGVHHLRGLIDAAEAGRQYAELAEAVLAALVPVVIANFSEKHGAPPGRGIAVFGMGSLGAGWLTAGSDLDLIVVYDPHGQENSEGRRPLATRPYYARLTQALVTALTAPMGTGRLYEVDMRLRPSGRQGPVATSLAAFEAYQRTEAWLWEHMALTRARCVAGSAQVRAEAEAVRTAILDLPRAAVEVWAEVARMRTRLAAAKPPHGPLDVKPGPGGLQDIELLAQAAALLARSTARRTVAQLEAAARAGVLERDAVSELAATYRLARAVQSAGRLLIDGPLTEEALGQGASEVLLRATEEETVEALSQRLAHARTAAAGRIEQALAAAEVADP